MLNEIMWNIFEETGNIYAYLYVREYNKCLMEHDECCYNKNGGNNIYCHPETDRISLTHEGSIS